MRLQTKSVRAKLKMPPRTARVGTRAPNFSLTCTTGSEESRQQVELDDFTGRWLILFFYSRDFSLLWPIELTAFSGRIAEFRDRECDVLAVSTDSLETHERWIATAPAQGGIGQLNFPLASDEDGTVARAFDVYVPVQKLAMRGLFIIDSNGVLQYQVVHSLSIGRNADEIRRVLEGLQSGGLCPGERDKPLLSLDQEMRLGRIIGSYRIDEALGSGSFGAVFRAHDSALDRVVALKVLRPDSSGTASGLLTEARVAAALNHPNLCKIHTVDSTLGMPMIVMEYVPGRPLAELIESKQLSPAVGIALVRQVAQGMAVAHAQEVVHGDLKPANILVTPEGAAKVMDFGMARRVRGNSVAETVVWKSGAPGAISGTPAYMAPEQARGEPTTAASDVYALGLIMYEVVTGRRARPEADILQVLRRIDREEASHFTVDLLEPFATLLSRALMTDQTIRTITMAEIAAALS